ncbi:MAG: VanZ family protein [Anaerolineales bacterium]|nr:VanZ family protein [Anaerolineales bacterium]
MARLYRWLPAIVLMVLIFLLSSIPSDEMPSLGFWDKFIKKTGHFLGYGLLALAYWHGLGWERKRFGLAFLFTVLYALSDELHQAFVPGRNPSLLDALVIDAGGGMSALLLARWKKR